MEVMRKCPICGYSKIEYIKTINLNLSKEMRGKINYPKSHDIVCCDKCGMVYANSSLSKDDVDNYYISCNMYDNLEEVESEVQLEVCEINFNALMPYLTDETQIIDVGCGGGVFLKYLKNKGYNKLYGMDPSESSVNRLKEAGINGIIGSMYEEIPKEWHEKFDVVVCTSVFEHLLFPDSALKNLTKLVKNDGIIYLVVPDAEGFCMYLREVPNYFNHEHINYFTTKTLDYLCSRNGLMRLSPDEECRHILMPSSPEMAVFAVYQFTTKGSDKVIDIPDENGKNSVIEYFRLIEQRQKQNRRRIEKLIDLDKQIIIWGTGSLSSALLSEIPNLENNVECFIDNDSSKQGTTHWGKEIFGPDVLMSYPNAIVMVCIMINRDSVINQIRGMKLENELFLLS